jgi:hypothetical protein
MEARAAGTDYSKRRWEAGQVVRHGVTDLRGPAGVPHRKEPVTL